MEYKLVVKREAKIMEVQYFSNEYVYEAETVDLIEKINDKYKTDQGKILYKFPAIKELDKMVIKPGLFIASESMGIVVVVVDTMQNLRDKEIEQFQEKIEIIDNYIYTSLINFSLPGSWAERKIEFEGELIWLILLLICLRRLLISLSLFGRITLLIGLPEEISKPGFRW